MARLARIAVAMAVSIAVLGMLGRIGDHLREPDDLGAVAAHVPGRYISVDGHRVHIVERGAGPPLLLVHGFGGSTFDWEQHVLEPLARTHRVVAVDLWGMGFTERRDDIPLDFVQFAEQLRGTLDALGIERASVAGHSMGGAVASVFAARHPTCVDGMILVAGLAPMPGTQLPWPLLAMRIPVVGEIGLALTDNLAPSIAQADYRRRMAAVSRIAGSRAALMRYLRRPDKFAALEAAYPVISAPTLVVHGTADDNVPYTAAQRATSSIRGARLVTLEGKGHWLLWEDPDRVVSEIDGFTLNR